VCRLATVRLRSYQRRNPAQRRMLIGAAVRKTRWSRRLWRPVYVCVDFGLQRGGSVVGADHAEYGNAFRSLTATRAPRTRKCPSC